MSSTSDELVERLRKEAPVLDAIAAKVMGGNTRSQSADTMRAAADAIEQMREEIAGLREALELFTGQTVFDPHTHRAPDTGDK